MKIFYALLLTCLFTACVKEEPSVLTCKIDGKEWTSTTSVIDRRDDKIVLSGQVDGGELFIITVPDESIGNYQLNFFDRNVLFFKSGTQWYLANEDKGNGNLNISKIESAWFKASMSGTFSFTAYSTNNEKVTVTDGVFRNVPFVEDE